jgi:hypothetical protein
MRIDGTLVALSYRKEDQRGRREMTGHTEKPWKEKRHTISRPQAVNFADFPLTFFSPAPYTESPSQIKGLTRWRGAAGSERRVVTKETGCHEGVREKR